LRITIAVAIVATGLLAATPASAGRDAPIEDLIDIPVATVSGNPVTLDVLARAIVSGCARRGWVCEVTSPGEIKGVLNIRTHRAEVRIPYDTAKYSILYVSSENLRYDAEEKTIHRNYNKWVANLRNDINSAIALLP